MDPMILSALAGVAAIALVVGVFLALGKSPGAAAEERLEQLASGRRRARKEELSQGILLRPRGFELPGGGAWLPKLDGLVRLHEQADVGLDCRQFLIAPAVLMALAAGGALVLGLSAVAAGLVTAALGALPFAWLVLRRRKRIRQFTAQMPDALELVGRALRAGHGLAAGLRVVAEETAPPIAHEFGRVFEEQNLGIPIEDALRGLGERVPTMDVRFLVTAVIIQRSAGGDLAEILDKIGRLVRERFQIQGQVQALTGEGRLSGAVLLALPPGLLAVLYVLNPAYVNQLFTTPMGTKMLAGAAVLQALGAVAIKKIITIKV